MKVVKESSYARAVGFSLLFHALLFSLLGLGDNMTVPLSAAAPIEVEFVPANMVSTGDTLQELNSLAPSPEASHSKQAVPEQADQRQQAVPPREAGQADPWREAAVGTTAAAGTAVAIPEAGSGDSGGRQERGAPSEAAASPAGYVSGSRPAYPRAAWQAGWEGAVVVRVLVGTDGSAKAVSVQGSSGHESLDEAAVQAVQQWRFRPAVRGKTAVEGYYDVRVRFRLSDWK